MVDGKKLGSVGFEKLARRWTPRVLRQALRLTYQDLLSVNDIESRLKGFLTAPVQIEHAQITLITVFA